MRRISGIGAHMRTLITPESYRGFISALRTLSILTVPGRDASSMASALPWFPLVGGLLGLIVYGVTAGADYILGSTWAEAAGFLGVASGIILTRGFHLDGLSDWADGFGGYSNRKRILEIMKDSHVGVFGVLALIIVLLGKWIAITRLAEIHCIYLLPAALIISRTMVVALAVSLPYARPEGGTAASVVSDAGYMHLIIAGLSAAALLSILYGWNGLLLMGIGAIVCAGFGWSCNRRLGGITGDLLGTCNELVELSVLFAAVVVGMGIR